MDRARIDGIELEYEITGSGEPVLLVAPVVADGFVPLVSEPALGDYQLIRYHKRGWLGSTHTAGPVSIEQHAEDAIGLLDRIGVHRAHLVGHSSGACIAAQIALDTAERVVTVGLLEPSPLTTPAGQAFARQASPVFDLYGSGNHEAALAAFMSAVSGLDWSACQALLTQRIPDAVANGVKDIQTLFEIELPSLTKWSFDADKVARIRQPVLSVVGSETGAMWLDIAAFMRTTIPNVDERTIEGAGHLLQIQEPTAVATAIADFLRRHPIGG